MAAMRTRLEHGVGAFRQLLVSAARDGGARVGALMALRERPLWVVVVAAQGIEPRTVWFAGGEAALPVFSGTDVLMATGLRLGWVDPSGRIEVRRLGGREALRLAIAEGVRWVVVDAATPHGLVLCRPEVDAVLAAGTGAEDVDERAVWGAARLGLVAPQSGPGSQIVGLGSVRVAASPAERMGAGAVGGPLALGLEGPAELDPRDTWHPSQASLLSSAPGESGPAGGPLAARMPVRSSLRPPVVVPEPAGVGAAPGSCPDSQVLVADWASPSAKESAAAEPHMNTGSKRSGLHVAGLAGENAGPSLAPFNRSAVTRSTRAKAMVAAGRRPDGSIDYGQATSVSVSGISGLSVSGRLTGMAGEPLRPPRPRSLTPPVSEVKGLFSADGLAQRSGALGGSTLPGELMEQLTLALRRCAAVAWACVLHEPEELPAIGLRVDAAYLSQVTVLSDTVADLAAQYGVELTVLILHGPQEVQRAEQQGLRFYTAS